MAVVGSRCACCGKVCFVENVEAAAERERTGEAVFCQSCMELPEGIAAFLIIINGLRQKLCQCAENVTG